MINLYTVSTRATPGQDVLTDGEKLSVYYHDLFDFPLNLQDLIKWQAGKNVMNLKNTENITSKNGYLYLEAREGLIYKRLLRKRISTKKLLIAKKAAGIFSLIPGVKMVAVTGSLAMENSSDESDIDLLIVAKKGTLWTTRLLSYFVLSTMRFALRKPNDRNQKDKFCLNMWLDESDLVWKTKDRNLYTAHEIAQITPLVNKNKTYEKFIYKNKWILKFWPNAIRINEKVKVKSGKVFSFSFLDFPLRMLEKLAYQLQLGYMRPKITRELVTPTRALFHPQDWGKVVMSRLGS